MKNTIGIVSGVLLLAMTLGACSGPGTNDAGDGTGGTGGSTGGAGGSSGNWPKNNICGERTCSSLSHCCTSSPEQCGLDLPQDVFVEGCVPEIVRGGALDVACPDSRVYAPQGYVSETTFSGCKMPSGECGYWVDGYGVVNRFGEGFVLTETLGCLSVEEFVP